MTNEERVRGSPIANRRSIVGNDRRDLSTTEDTEDRRFNPEEKAYSPSVPRVLGGGEL